MIKIFLIKLVVVMLGCHVCEAQNQVQWRVHEKIEDYGESLTLACTASNKSSPINNLWWYIEEKVVATDNVSAYPSKYQPLIDGDSGYLTIKNFGKEDINQTYKCKIGFDLSEKKLLSEDAVFHDKKPQRASLVNNGSPTEVILAIVIPLAFIIIVVIVCIRKRGRIVRHCKRGHTANLEDTETRIPLDAYPNVANGGQFTNQNGDRISYHTEDERRNVSYRHSEDKEEASNRSVVNDRHDENDEEKRSLLNSENGSGRHSVDNEETANKSVGSDKHHENDDEMQSLLNSENGGGMQSEDNEETANKSVGSDRHHENHEETQSLLNSENGGGMQSDDKEETSVLRYAENVSDQGLQNDGETQSMSDPGNFSNTHSKHNEAASMLEDFGNVPNRGDEGGGERTHASDHYNDLGRTAGPRNKLRSGGETPNSAPVVHLSGTDRNGSNSVHAPYKVIGKNTALAISGISTNVPVVSEDAENCGGREARDPKIPHREPINRGFQFTIHDPPEDNASASRVLSPRHREYNDIKIRIQSFTKPLPFSRPTKEELAEAGFFYSGYRSRANCFFCGKRCDFKDGDDPSDKHFHEDTCKHCKK